MINLLLVASMLSPAGGKVKKKASQVRIRILTYG